MRTFLRKTIRNHRGFTLVEMLAAVLISLLIAAGMTGVFIAHSRTYSIHEDVSDLAQGVRGVLSLMTSDFRIAGCDPLGTKDPGIVRAEATHLEYTTDHGSDSTSLPNEADGKITGNDERVSYRYFEGARTCNDGEEGVVSERNRRGVLCRKAMVQGRNWRSLDYEELADYDDIEKVEFNYILWDPKDKEFTTSFKEHPKDGTLKGDEIGRVTGVQISLLVRGKLEDPRYHHKGDPCPGNPNQYGFVAGSGTCWQLKDIYKDKETQEREFRHRRRLVITTVQFRNLGGK